MTARIAILIGAAVLGAMTLVVLLRGDGDARDRVGIEATFDTAKGLVPGQVVKVAGVESGTITDVDLRRVGRRGYRARVRFEIDRRFTPFRADARCRILPQGLLSENYVDCAPGSPSAPPLPTGRSDTQAVPVEQTSVPASLQDVLNTFSMPTSQRLSVLINELGLGTAGRAEDLDGILRRANPALDRVGAVMREIGGQRSSLQRAIVQTDRVLTDLARRDDDVRALVKSTARFTGVTARRSTEIQAAIDRLPRLLSALDRTLPSVRRAASQGTPLLADLRRAAPDLREFTQAFAPFTSAARPALRSLGAAAATGRRALSVSRPTFTALRRLSSAAAVAVPRLDALLRSTRESGGLEALGRFIYGQASGFGPHDRIAHVLPLFISVNPRCIMAAMEPGRQVAPRCSHAFSSPGLGREPQTLNEPIASGRRAGGDAKRLKDFLDYLLG